MKTIAESCVTGTSVELVAFTVIVDDGPPGLHTFPEHAELTCTEVTILIGRRVLLGSFFCWGGEKVVDIGVNAGVNAGVVCDAV